MNKYSLFLIFFGLLLVPVNAFAYPVLFGTSENAIQSYQLNKPLFSIDTSHFAEDGNIAVNVTFDNAKSHDGLIVQSEPRDESISSTSQLQSMFDNGYNGRIIGITVNDISDSKELDKTLLKVTSNYNLKSTVDHTEGLTDSLQLEILDIEQNAKGDVFSEPLKFSFDFDLASTEFQIGHTYEIQLYTLASGSNIETFELKETPKVEISKVEEIPKAETVKSEPIAEVKQEKQISEPIKETIVDPEPKITIDPEPTVESRSCGPGTELLHGVCVLQKSENLLEKFFKMIFNLFV